MSKSLIVLLAFAFIIALPVSAVTMDSSRFQIESASVTDGAVNTSSSNYKLSDTLGQLAAGQFSSTGYVVKAGFQYLHSIIPFRFAISNISVNLGSLTPDTPATGNTTITVYFGGAGQYQVTAIEETPLKTLAGATIPDTSCNGGVNTCSESQAKLWDQSTTYGFGYNMTGDDIPADFVNSTYFRPFPDRSNSESPAVVMSSVNVGKNRQAVVTFKSNVSALQQAGTYQTVVSFVATPSY